MGENEWGWFRTSLADSLVRPRRFAQRVAREHYGLAGIVVALVAGVALSVAVDVAVILSKAADPLAFITRLLLDAFFLGVRLLIVAALLGLLAVGMARLARRPITLDQAFTALSFATSPLLFAPVVIVLMLVAAELPAGYRGAPLLLALVVSVVLVARLAAGVVLNLSALVGGATILIGGAALIAGALVLQDQIGRVAFTALAYAPQVLPPPAASPADGQEVRLENGMRLRLPADWIENSRGIPGILAQYERPDARLVVRLKSVAVLTTADSFASGEVQNALRDFTRIDRTARRFVRIDGVVATDDRWYGRIDETRLVERLYTLVVGGRGYLLEFEFFSPPDEEGALELAARIAASIRLPVR